MAPTTPTRCEHCPFGHNGNGTRFRNLRNSDLDSKLNGQLRWGHHIPGPIENPGRILGPRTPPCVHVVLLCLLWCVHSTLRNTQPPQRHLAIVLYLLPSPSHGGAGWSGNMGYHDGLNHHWPTPTPSPLSSSPPNPIILPPQTMKASNS